MRYRYKNTGLIVESGVALDSLLFQLVQEKEGTPSTPIADAEGKEREKTKTRATTRKKDSTSQKSR